MADIVEVSCTSCHVLSMRQSETFHGNLEAPALLSVSGISACFCENAMATAYLGEQVVPYFDEAYYLRQFPDVAAAVASGVFSSGWEHFRMFGVVEGRVASPLLDLDVYRANNPDLADAGLTSNASLVLHFYVYGREENRAFVSESVFDWEYYLEKNPDLVAAGISTREAAQNHFLNFGINEGRIVHPNIEGASYIDKHPDLAAYVGGGGTLAGLTDKAAIGIWHYLNYGFAEGRELGNPQPAPPAPVPPAPPVDDSPSVTFRVLYESVDDVISFGGSATGTISMSRSYDSVSHETSFSFSRGGVAGEGSPVVLAAADLAGVSISLGNGDTLSANAEAADSVDFVSTGTGKVSISGSSGSQNLTGTQGDDSLAGGAGDDILTGGAGVDTFTLEGNDRVTDFDNANGDSLVLSALSSGHTVTFDSVTGTLDFSKAGDGAKLVVTTASGSSTITGGGGDDTITGGAGNDTITGGAGADVITGGSGTNTYHYTQASDSTINNVVSTASGFDSLDFNSGDVLDFGLDVVAVRQQQYYVGAEPLVNGDALLTQLNSAYQDAGPAGGVDAIYISLGNNDKGRFFIIDADNNNQITDSDLIVGIVGVTDNKDVQLALTGGNVTLNEVDPPLID